MSDYIKREDVMKELDKEVEDADDWKTAHEIANVVKYFPSADVVEVVRCKDCKFGDWKVSEVVKSVKGYMCPIHAVLAEKGLGDNGYCICGKRKDDE